MLEDKIIQQLKTEFSITGLKFTDYYKDGRFNWQQLVDYLVTTESANLDAFRDIFDIGRRFSDRTGQKDFYDALNAKRPYHLPGSIISRSTPLSSAAANGKIELVESLLDYGANIEISVDPLSLACYNGHLEVVRLLIKRGADVNKDVYGDYGLPLRYACSEGHFDIVELLLENNADVHAENDNALERASANGHLKIVKLLVKKGAGVAARGRRALSQARANNHDDVVEFLTSVIN